jgi:putative ABC transport system permease protein
VLQNLIADVRYAVRSLRKNFGFTVLAVVVMALGIGANTAVFSAVNSVLLRPLGYQDPDRIVTVANQWKTGGAPQGQVSAPDFHDWHDQTTAFAALAYYSNAETSLTAGPTAEYGRVASVTPEFFHVCAVDP